jgi:hypothetical protein
VCKARKSRGTVAVSVSRFNRELFKDHYTLLLSRSIGIRQLEFWKSHPVSNHRTGLRHNVPVENKRNLLPAQTSSLVWRNAYCLRKPDGNMRLTKCSVARNFTWSIRGYLLFTSSCRFAWSLTGIIWPHNETCHNNLNIIMDPSSIQIQVGELHDIFN